MIATINNWARKLPSWVVYTLGLLPIPWLFYAAIQGRLGVEPVEALEHRYGLLALQFLLAGLAITPLMRLAKIKLIKFRRALGLICFAYVVAHLSVWLVLDVGNLSAVWQDIAKRPYITIGMLAFVLLIPLAVTSNNASIRRLGSATWKNIHRLVYPAVLLGSLHFVMLRKGFQLEPLLYLALALVLLALRVNLNRRSAVTG